MSYKEQVRLERKERVILFRTSGLPMKTWCAQQGVKVNKLQYWNAKYQMEESKELLKKEWAAVNLVN